MSTINVVGSRDVKGHVVERCTSSDEQNLTRVATSLHCVCVEPHFFAQRTTGHSRTSTTRPLSVRSADLPTHAADPVGALRRAAVKFVESSPRSAQPAPKVDELIQVSASPTHVALVMHAHRCFSASAPRSAALASTCSKMERRQPPTPSRLQPVVRVV